VDRRVKQDLGGTSKTLSKKAITPDQILKQINIVKQQLDLGSSRSSTFSALAPQAYQSAAKSIPTRPKTSMILTTGPTQPSKWRDWRFRDPSAGTADRRITFSANVDFPEGSILINHRHQRWASYTNRSVSFLSYPTQKLPLVGIFGPLTLQDF
jgi:hypothetical protein